MGPGDDVVHLAQLDHSRADSNRRWATHEYARIVAEQQQHLIDAQVRLTRWALIRALHQRHGVDPLAILDQEFLAVADRPAIAQAVLDAAVAAGGADACDLQLIGADHQTLRIEAHRGFTDRFLTFFATVDGTQPTACAAALATGAPIIVDDVTRSPIFAGHATLDVLLDAGSRAVQSYPLFDADGLLFGILSFHSHRPHPARGNPELVAWTASQALSHAGPVGDTPGQTTRRSGTVKRSV